MATKLHDTYGYNYNNLKVLLGGWNTWNQKHGEDPNGYPTESTPGGAATAAPGARSDTTTVPIQLAPGTVVVVAPTKQP